MLTTAQKAEAALRLLAGMAAGNSENLRLLRGQLDALPAEVHRQLASEIFQKEVGGELEEGGKGGKGGKEHSAGGGKGGRSTPEHSAEGGGEGNEEHVARHSAGEIMLLSADRILSTVWPEPVWAIPGILPTGLGILAGAPKVGKSWLALQIAEAVAGKGKLWEMRVERGPVLYLALEDPPARLNKRMRAQKWERGVEADFLTVGLFMDQIGDLRNGGGEKLARIIEKRRYRLVVIDTLSRSIHGDQQDVREMTEWLAPLQEMAHARNAAVLLVDHHKKASGFDQDVVGDVLGSTAKGAMADTVLGLYRERGKSGARLAIVGRDVEERTIELVWDGEGSCWRLEEEEGRLTPQRSDLLEVLEEHGPMRLTELAEMVERRKGNVLKQLAELERAGKVVRRGMEWATQTTSLEAKESTWLGAEEGRGKGGRGKG